MKSLEKPLIRRNWEEDRAAYPPLEGKKDLHMLLRPETEMEAELLEIPDFQQGLCWGEPRFGHPEGKIAYHVRDVLDNIDQLEVNGEKRATLRLLALIHDTFKFREDTNRPRDWSRHHGMLARNFFQRFSEEEYVLDILELHDEAFYAWRLIHISQNFQAGDQRLQRLFDRLEDQMPLYRLFYQCDTQTGNKIQNPLLWFESLLK